MICALSYLLSSYRARECRCIEFFYHQLSRCTQGNPYPSANTDRHFTAHRPALFASRRPPAALPPVMSPQGGLPPAAHSLALGGSAAWSNERGKGRAGTRTHRANASDTPVHSHASYSPVACARRACARRELRKLAGGLGDGRRHCCRSEQRCAVLDGNVGELGCNARGDGDGGEGVMHR